MAYMGALNNSNNIWHVLVLCGGQHGVHGYSQHIFVAVITFPPFFCANTFDTSLLLIVCALR